MQEKNTTLAILKGAKCNGLSVEGYGFESDPPT